MMINIDQHLSTVSNVKLTFDFFPGPDQGRKSMFKHGRDNTGVKYTSRLRDVSRGTKRRALLGGFGGMRPQENFFKWYNLVRFGVYLDQILCLKNCKNYHLL